MRQLRCSSFGYESQSNCSCVKCDWKPKIEEAAAAAMPGLHCCADNGATIEYGRSWERSNPGNANASDCRAECARTSGCSHYVYSDAPDECTDDLRFRTPGRCTLCAACTQRLPTPTWQWAFTSFALYERLRGSPHDGSASHRWARDGGDGAEAPTPAAILSGCDKRYERAAAVARRAGLAPSWVPAVFPSNVHPERRDCSWPLPVERNLVAAHRNAWSLIASTNVSMVVLEDDIELAGSSARLQLDVRRCEARRTTRDGACLVLFLGFVDAYWATHALYVTPPGARRLLERSSKRCPEPTDYHTHRLCLLTADFGQTDHRLAPHCLAPTGFHGHFQGHSHGSALHVAREAQHALARPALERSQALRAPELYGAGHFTQNRTLGRYIHSQNALNGRFGGGTKPTEGQGANC